MTIESPLNWNTEVYVYFFAGLICFISVGLIFREYRRTKSGFYMYLTFSWAILNIYIILGGVALLIRSQMLFTFEILLLIPSSFFLILVFDKLTRSSLDPIKMLVFGFMSSGIILHAFKSDATKEIVLRSGAPSFQTGGFFHVGLSIFTGLIGTFFFYYCILIYIRAPRALKKKAFLTLLGGFFFNIVAFLLYITRLTKVIPGIMLVTLALGAFLSSLYTRSSPNSFKY